MTHNAEHASAHPVRIPPLPPEEWSEAARAAMAVLPPIMQPPPGQQINSLGVFAQHPALGAEVLGFSLYFRFRSTLDDRTRELLIIRTAYLRGARYELLRHARLGRRLGFTDEDLLRLAEGPDAPGWDIVDRLTVRAVDELCRDFRISDATWQALSEHYSQHQLMDLLFLVGCYNMFAMAWNSIGVQPEDDLPPYPTAALPPRT